MSANRIQRTRINLIPRPVPLMRADAAGHPVVASRRHRLHKRGTEPRDADGNVNLSVRSTALTVMSRDRTGTARNCAILVVAVTLLAAFQARAQCGQRDISGRWKIQIKGSAATEVVDLKQSGGTVTGRVGTEVSTNLVATFATVTGNVDGEKMRLHVEWTNDRYTIRESFDGTFADDGRVSGTGQIWALAGPVSVEWTSDHPMQCLSKKVGSLGVKRTNPVDRSGSTARSVFIIAAPNNIILPTGIGVGQTTLAWDAGPDHPYAEVWVKIDGQDATKVLERGKGTLPVVVEPGKTYLYILTDAGTTLATVTVRFQR
jgi:hypothetical protein